MYVETLRAGGAVVDGFVAAAMGDVDQVRRTLDADATFARARDATGLTALHCATASRMIRIDVARLLLDRGAEVHATVRSWDHDVDAPYFAVSSGQLDVFELLLDRGADPTAALPAGAWKADPAFADAALRRGADPDKATSGGRPLLNDLVRWGQVTQALWLLGRGASPNVADPQGWTALHQAASRGNERMLRAVLDAGGDKRARDRGGMVPRDIAQVMGRRKLLPLL
jgi:ankyrin repeat protein